MSNTDSRKEDDRPAVKRWGSSLLGFASGYSSMTRQAAILKNRLSFPLLRQVLAGEMESQNRLLMLDQLSEQQLSRSRAGHFLILLVMVPTGLWALLTLVRGVAAAVRFDVYLNNWLMTGIPLTIFIAIKIATSLKAYKLFSGELSARRSPNA